jgi:hypothetical protein
VDKLDKEAWEEIQHEMVELKGLPVAKAELLGRFVANKAQARDLEYVEELCKTFPDEKAKERCAQGVASLRKLLEFCALMKVCEYFVLLNVSAVLGFYIPNAIFL